MRHDDENEAVERSSLRLLAPDVRLNQPDVLLQLRLTAVAHARIGKHVVAERVLEEGERSLEVSVVRAKVASEESEDYADTTTATAFVGVVRHESI